MIVRLVLRSLALRPGRSALLLLGYALGVGVMVALLSIGDALVEQSRDRDLLGGGDLVVLPAGIDLETLRTGGVSSLYFTLDQAPFFYREVLAGPRLAQAIDAAAPWIDDELLYLAVEDRTLAVSAGGEIPSRAAALGAEAELLAGSWRDGPGDRRWADPTAEERLSEIDAFHRPPAAVAGDSTWAEWHYFSILSPDGDEWLYLTFLVGGDLAGDRWGGRILLTHASRAGATRRWEHDVAASAVDLSFDRPDLRLDASTVTLGPDGRYRVVARVPGAPDVSLEVDLVPALRRYLPAIDVSPGSFPSGYAVPVLRASADVRLCEGSRCRAWAGARAYHDHNWGVWRDVTWDWGQVQAGELSILYGGVGRQSSRNTGGTVSPGSDSSAASASAPGSRFLFVVDSLGLAAILPIRDIEYEWEGGVPSRFRVEASRGAHWLRLTGEVSHADRTPRGDGATDSDVFVQMRGTANVEAFLPIGEREARGDGFFETWQVAK